MRNRLLRGPDAIPFVLVILIGLAALIARAMVGKAMEETLQIYASLAVVALALSLATFVVVNPVYDRRNSSELFRSRIIGACVMLGICAFLALCAAAIGTEPLPWVWWAAGICCIDYGCFNWSDILERRATV